MLYTDGEVQVIEGPTTATALRPRFLHQKLREQLADEPRLWPIDEPFADSLCKKYHPFIAALAQCLRPPLQCDRMSALELYAWFIATEPQEIDGQLVLGLSHVEELMGIVRQKMKSDQKSFSPPAEDVVEGTGDALLDLIVDCHLVFKRAAPGLIKKYPVRTLHEMTAYAARRHQSAMEKMKRETRTGEQQPATTPALSPQQSPAPSLPPGLADKLRGLGIDTPE